MKRLSAKETSTALAFALTVLMTAGATTMSAADDRVVATVGTRRITQQEVDARIKAQLTSIESQEYELRRRTIESMADDYLIEQAAKKANLSVGDYLKREIDEKVSAPNEAEMQKFYGEHKGQINQPFDKVRPQLSSLLRRQQSDRRRSDLLASLRADQPVTIALKVPRFNVASEGHPELGPKDAPVTIVEFGDFQCPYCKKAEESLKEVRAKYADKLRLIYMDFPLNFHANAMSAAIGSRCAGEQGKFWQFHDQVFVQQSRITPTDLKAAAAKLGLDTARFDSCLDSRKFEAAVRRDMAQGQTLGVEGTPAFFINGRGLSGAQPASEFEQIIDEELSPSSERMAKAHP